MGKAAKPGVASRRESDELGAIDVPLNALYGVQTARAMDNFPVSGITIGQFPDLIRALALTKKAAAKANARLGQLSAEKAEIICRVCDEILLGHHHHHFPVDVFQGGAGTSTNMNANEVIANRGLELMGRRAGDYAYLHPDNDVDRGQTTGDVYPTAIRVALMTSVPVLMDALGSLAEAFEANGERFSDVPKAGHTEQQDALPMTLGDEMRAYCMTIREDIERLRDAIRLLTDINLGGAVTGTRATATPKFQSIAVAELAALTGLALKPATDLIEASWDAGAFVHLSGVLKRVAAKLSKICNDLRLLSSGPRGGLGEIRLPQMQPGSSLMPGKVSPVIAEMVNQVAFQVIGTDVTITIAAEAGQLQLNAFEPLMAYGLLQSVTLLRNATEILRQRCVEGILANREATDRTP